MSSSNISSTQAKHSAFMREQLSQIRQIVDEAHKPEQVNQESEKSEESIKKEEAALKAKQEQESRLVELAFQQIPFPDSFHSLKIRDALLLYLMDFISQHSKYFSEDCHTLILTFLHTFSDYLSKPTDEAFFKNFFSKLDPLLQNKEVLLSLKKVCMQLKILAKYSEKKIGDFKKEKSDPALLYSFSAKPMQTFCEWSFSLLLQILDSKREELDAISVIIVEPDSKKILFKVKNDKKKDRLNSFQKRLEVLKKRFLIHKAEILRELAKIATSDSQKNVSFTRCQFAQLLQRFLALKTAVDVVISEISKDYDTLFFTLPEKQRKAAEEELHFFHLVEKEGTFFQDLAKRYANASMEKPSEIDEFVGNIQEIFSTGIKSIEESNDKDAPRLRSALQKIDEILTSSIISIKEESAQSSCTQGQISNLKIYYKKIARILHSLNLLSNMLRIQENLIKTVSAHLPSSSLSEEEIDALWLEEDSVIEMPEQELLSVQEEMIETKNELPEKKIVQHGKTKIIFSDLLGAFYFLKEEIFLSSSSNWMKLRQRDLLHHLTLLLSTLELVKRQENQEKILPAMIFRLVKNIAHCCEEGNSIHVLSKIASVAFFKHDLISESKKYGFWADLSPSTKGFLKDINGGSVFHRYPHKMESIIKKDLPEALHWLLTDSISKKEIDALIEEAFAFIGSLYPQAPCEEILDCFHNVDPVLTQDSANNSLGKLIESKKFPFRSLLAQVKKLASLNRINDPYAKRKETHWKDIGKHISWLKENLQLWISFPQLKFFGSHVDAILTNLQFIDEQIEACLNLDHGKQIVRSNDLKYLREVRGAEIEPFVAELNVHPGEGYPHRMSVQYKKGELPSALSLRLKAVAISQSSEALDTEFTPVKAKKDSDYLNESKELVIKLIDLIEAEVKSAEKRVSTLLRS